MLSPLIKPFRWTVERARVGGVAAAFVAVIVLRMRNETHLDIIALLIITLSAIEIAMFATIAAFYLSDQSEWNVATNTQCAEALVAWFVVFFAAMWVNNALVRASVDAYVSFGLPPIL